MKKKKVVFKKYVQNQPVMFPPSLEEMVPEKHPVRVVNDIVERIDISELERSYKGGGASSYHPRMLLKVLIYAYLRNVYSSRKIEMALCENVHFMWLSGGAKPDHNTINDFRGKRLEGQLKGIFNRVVMLLAGEGVLSLKELTVDGTKIEANANRYTFVWGRAIRVSRERIERQLRELWAYVEQIYALEENQPNAPEFEGLDAEAVERAVREINEALRDKPVRQKVKQKLAYAKKNWPKKLAEYDEKEKILAERKSFSKTDEDATFMRMKEDHMRNGQLKPGYNLQASTEGHYIVGYTLGQKTNDTALLKEHLEDHIHSYGAKPETLTADAGYGSEENYEYLEREGIRAYVKYNYFEKETTDKKHRENPFIADNLYYNERDDVYYCPMGQPMRLVKSGRQRTASGYLQKIKYYQAARCLGCPMRGPCHRSRGDRIIQRNENMVHHRKKARELLESEEGIRHRRERWRVEAVFGNIKHNKNFKRFMLRGLDKVTVETGLIALAHNLQRYATGH
jgi:transposase